MAKKKPQDKTQSGTHRKPVFWISIFVALGAVFFPPTMMVLLSGMIPSIVAALLNTKRGSGSLPAMIALNLAGVIPVLGILWQRGGNFHQAFLLLADVYMWLAMFGGAGIAMFLTWSVPVCVYAIYDVQAKSSIRKLLKQRRKLVDEWGNQVAGNAPAENQ
ncbi:hypothetical protein NBZ79_06975 [Sneathiella marina]|uniref:Acyl-CoA synthetase n=1 Tax=Sneathiella marina TaxID=2950108 RepID=A0ABY4W6Q6_9PROT|nr:hypothetical protein [Sneathiella marina]USG62718.1 hypothetical protein NBZ79_06975 [Sneathiella marina]